MESVDESDPCTVHMFEVSSPSNQLDIFYI